MSLDYANLVYEGKWMTPLKEAMDLFMEKVNENTSGSVKVKLYKGNMYPAGIFADKALLMKNLQPSKKMMFIAKKMQQALSTSLAYPQRLMRQ